MSRRTILWSIVALILIGGGIVIAASPRLQQWISRSWDWDSSTSEGPGRDTETFTDPIFSPEDETRAFDATARFPRLHAIVFHALANTPACQAALAAFDVVRTGTVDENNVAALLGAKKQNPSLRTFTHMSLRYVEANWFEYGATHPRAFIVDRVSPRHFAYPRLMRLQTNVQDPSQDVFEFPADDIAYLKSLGVKGMDELGADRWAKKIQFEPYYFQFFDNDAGAEKGTVEIMAIQRLWTDGDRGFIEAAHRRDDQGNETRTIYGTAQRYSRDARAGVLSSTNSEFGALVFLTNLWCMNQSDGFCASVNESGSFLDVAVAYVRDTQMLRKEQGIFMVDGTTLDADDEDGLKAYSYRFAGASTNTYKLDMNGDGSVDALDEIEQNLPDLYAEYARRVKEAGRNVSRPDFFVVMNGRLLQTIDGKLATHPDFDGREFEDLNGGFNEPSVQSALQQYYQLFNGLIGAENPVVTISSRDRKATNADQFNLREHRATLAATLVFGDGYYGAMGSYDSSIPQCYDNKEPETWMDEFSVTSSGQALTEPSNSAESRRASVHWLGKATSAAEVLDEQSFIYGRSFEHGMAIFSGKGGTVKLSTPMHRLCGTDPVNDCEKNSSEVTLEPFDGILLITP